MAYIIEINIPGYLEHKAETIMPDFKVVISNLLVKNNNHYKVEKYTKIKGGEFSAFPHDYNVFEFTGIDALSDAKICAFKFAIEVI